MKRIVVGIIDTGLDTKCKYFLRTNYEACSVKQDGNVSLLKSDYEDKNGHGTACASIIINECPNVEFFIINAFGESGKTNLVAIEKALKILKETSVDIINMSFAITTAPGNELSDLCLELSKNKIVVAAAANNYDGRSFPACYESVCGVRGGKIKNNKVYEIDTSKEIQCLFDNNPLMSMTLNNEYQMLPTNNSLITAKFTGMICQCISKYDIQKEKYTDILQIMQKENREQKSKIYTSSQEWYMDNNDELLQAIYELLKSVLQLHKPTNNICDIELLTSTQNVYIKDDSIENNILMGRKKEDCAYDEICKLVGMESILSKFPKEKDVSVGENGNKLSGGQKQRIAMARALVHADNVLILDEATSALDNITQNEIMKNIKPLYQDKIVIIITHRLDTISDVDKIFVMSEGRICEEGQHNELMKKGEKYYALVQNL